LAHAQPISPRLTEDPPVHAADEAEGQEYDHYEVDTGVDHSENTVCTADIKVSDCQSTLSTEQGICIKVQNPKGGKGSEEYAHHPGEGYEDPGLYTRNATVITQGICDGTPGIPHHKKNGQSSQGRSHVDGPTSQLNWWWDGGLSGGTLEGREILLVGISRTYHIS